MKKSKSKIERRSFTIAKDESAINEAERTVELAFSSEEPYERSFGIEILDHSPQSILLDRMTEGGPVLVDHDPTDHVGVVESVSIDGDRRGRAKVRFGRGARATEIFNDVVDGIRRSISVGYRVLDMVLEREATDGNPPVYRVNKWMPLEVSLVSIPADATVGIGRSDENTEEDLMTEEVKSEEVLEAPVEEVKSEEVVEEVAAEEVAEEIVSEEVVEEKAEEPVEAPVIDVNAEREDAIRIERRRVSAITEMGEKAEAVDLAKQYIDGGYSADEFNAALLERMTEESKPMSVEKEEVGLSVKEAKEFSFVRAIRALANPTDAKAQAEASFEREVSEAAAKAYGKEVRGIMVPNEVLHRDQTVGTAADGGNLVGTDHLGSSFIELLRNKMVIRALGAKSLTGLQGNIQIPTQSGPSTAYWVGENAAPTESKLAFGQKSATPHTVAAYVDMSRRLMIQSDPSIEALVRGDLAAQLALAADYAAIHGDSGADANQPDGILATSGIGDVAMGTNGGAIDWASIVDVMTEVAIDNADMGALKFLTNPKVAGAMKQTQKVTGEARFLLEGAELAGYPLMVSNQVRSDLDKGTSTGVCSALVYGNWNDLVICEWSGLDLAVDPYSLSTTGAVRVTAFHDLDFVVRHAESFAAILDITTA